MMERERFPSAKKNKKRRKRKMMAAAVIAGIWILTALLAKWLVPNDPYVTNPAVIRQAPSAAFWFGTDHLGRCVFSRVLTGAQVTIAATFFLVAVSFVIGTAAGMICGYFGGMIDSLLMRLADLMLAFPQMVVAIAVAGILGGGLGSAMIALGITMWTGFARLARSHTLSVKTLPYIQSAALAGMWSGGILLRHILPNILSPLLTNALTQIGTTMIGLSGLSFLGLGVVPPRPEWGSMISESRASIQLAPWAVFFPALATVLTITIFNYLGDAVMEYRNE